MKAIHILGLIFSLLSLSVNSQGTPELDKKLQALSGEKKNIGLAAGYSVAGETKWTSASGLLCIDSEIHFSPTTLTRIASISKNLTAVAVMQLVERNLLALDTRVGSILPDLPEDKRSITIRQLLGHTSGISQYYNEKEIENTIHYASLEDVMAVFIDRPLLFEPGSRYFYTTYGYVILGRVIEAVSFVEYGQYMRQNIFEPSKMLNTGVEDIHKTYPEKSCLYHNGGRKAKNAKQNDLSNRVPGGGFYSTVEDLIKFGNALLDGKLIRPESLDIMLEIQPVEYDGNKYGLGWTLYGPPPHENAVIGHGGGQTGCTSQLMIIPGSKTVVVVLSNTSGNYPDIATLASEIIAFSESNRK